MIKTPEQIINIKKAGIILANTLAELKNVTKPGVNGTYLDTLAQKIIKKNNALPAFLGFKKYPSAICLSINNEVVHGLPNNKIIQSGDLVSIDCGVKYHNMNADAAISFTIDCKNNSPEEKLIKYAWLAFNEGYKQIKDGATIGDLGFAIEKIINEQGYGLITQLTGHGIGESLHEEPCIPNYGKPNTGYVLRSGMTICIEPMITLGKSEIQTSQDGWTITTKDNSKAAHVEHTILVTKNGAEILTKIPTIC